MIRNYFKLYPKKIYTEGKGDCWRKCLLQICLLATRWSSCNCKTKIKPSHSRTSGAADDADLTEVDSATGFMSRTLMVLKGKTNPETRLSTEDLQVVLSSCFFKPGIDIPGTEESFLHLSRFKHIILPLLMTQAPASACSVTFFCCSF